MCFITGHNCDRWEIQGLGQLCFTHSAAFDLYTMCSGIPAVVGLFEGLKTLSLFLTTSSFALESSDWPLWWLVAAESSGWPLRRLVAAEFSGWPYGG